jgi:uncharacterized protein YcfJ
MKRSPAAAAAAIAIFLGGCATPPTGPTVAVMPAANKNFDAFQQDQATCTSYASQQVGGQAQMANNQAVGGAVLGTVLGAGIGAAAGGGPGAAIGAASGALVGTSAGAGYSGSTNYGTQQQYNIAYAQCMAAHGNQVQTTQAAYNQPAYGYAAGYYPYGYYPYGYDGGYPYWGFGVGCCWGGWGWRGGWGGGWHGGWHH